MNGKDPEKAFELLGQVKRVEAPPFLYTRIEARLSSRREPRVKAKWIWAGSLSFAMLLLFNLYIIKKHKQELNTAASEFSYLAAKNSIYE